MATKKSNGGFLKLLIIIIIGIFILSAMNVDLRELVNSPVMQNNIAYVYGGVKSVWDNYLRTPVMFFWNNTFKNVIIVPFAENMHRMISGQGTSTFFSLVPQFNIATSTATSISN